LITGVAKGHGYEWNGNQSLGAFTCNDVSYALPQQLASALTDVLSQGTSAGIK